MRNPLGNNIHIKRAAPVVGVLMIVCFLTLKAFNAAAPKELTQPTNPYLSYPQAEVHIGKARYTASLAQSPDQMTLGLSYVDAMPADRGMMFIFKQPLVPDFWMKDMKFDLDFVWIRNNKVVDVTPYVSSKSFDQLKITKPSVQADSVMELNAGQIEQNKIGVGDEVSVKYLQ